jgi:hypothetical protein
MDDDLVRLRTEGQSGVVIDVAKDFSKFPGGRFLTDGPFSGEKFRAEHLAGALELGRVTVLLDGAAGYGSGFLEEAFGGLVRHHTWTPSALRSRLYVVSSDAELMGEIWSYIEDAGRV